MDYNQLEINTFVNSIGILIKNHDTSAKVMYKKKNRINFSGQNNHVFFLESGSVSLYKKNDDLLLMKLSAPQVIGLFKIWIPNNYYYIRCDEECVFWIINHTTLSQKISDANLWQESFFLIADKVKKLFVHDSRTSFNCTRDIVLAHLSDIWSLPENERKKTSIYKYIMMRNHISRSAIYKTVTELEEQELITIRRGTLFSFKKDYFENFINHG